MNTRELNPACRTCRFWVQTVNGGNQGTCHRSPPVPLIVGARQAPLTNTTQPVAAGFRVPVREDDWCGEHVAKISVEGLSHE